MADLNASNPIILSKILRINGIDPETVAKMAEPFCNIDNTKINFYFDKGEVVIRVRSKAGSKAAATELLGLLIHRIEDTFGDFCYGEYGESMAEEVCCILTESDEIISIANEESGVYFETLFANCKDYDSVFDDGQYSYRDSEINSKVVLKEKEIEKYGEISAESNEILAKLTAKKVKSNYGISISGEYEIGNVIYISVFNKGKVYTNTLLVDEKNISYAQHKASVMALDIVRRIALDMQVIGEVPQSIDPDYDTDTGRKHSSIKMFFVVVLVLALVFGAVYTVMFFTNTLPESFKPSILVGTTINMDINSDQYDKVAMEKASGYIDENDSTVGLVIFEGLGVAQPVAKGEDNDFFTKHDYSGKISPRGAVFMDSESNPLLNMSNTVIYDKNGEYLTQIQDLAEENTLKDNAIFGYYTGTTADKYKVVSVFYTEPNDEYFNASKYASLNNYHNYLEFVLDIKVRSLIEMPVDLKEDDSFITVVTSSPLSKTGEFVVVGRRLRDDEVMTVSTDQITTASVSLQPTVYYEQTGVAPGNIATAYSKWMDWYLQMNMSNSDIQEQTGIPDDVVDDFSGAGSTVNPDDYLDFEDFEDTSDSSSSSNNSSSSSNSQSSSSSSSQDSSSSEDSSSSSSSSSSSIPDDFYAPDPDNEEMLTVTMNGAVMTDTATNIIAMVVSNEVGTQWGAEVCKAQAIATHSWIVNAIESGNPAPGVSGKAPTVPVLDAISQVSNLVMKYNGKTIFAPYTASTAGVTQSSQSVWGGYLPYLVSVPSIYENQSPNYYGTVTLSIDEMRGVLSERVPNANLDLDPSEWIKIISYADNGVYVGDMTIGGETTFYSSSAGRTVNITGNNFKSTIMYGYGLRSTAFNVTFDGTNFSVVTEGWGHGCGFSQIGAYYYNKNEGWGYDQILKHYYQGVTIEPR